MTTSTDHDGGLLVTEQDDVLVATLCRPEARNALNSHMVSAFQHLAHRLWDDRPGACVITATGPAFCAGGDLKERQLLSPAQTRHLRREIVTMFTALGRAPVPLIAAVNGHARGGGFELALACDFIVSAERATFALPEVDLGIIPAGGGTQNLVRAGGLNLAREVILLGRELGAAEAHRLGLVHAVVADSELGDAAGAIAKRLAGKPRLAVQQAKAAINGAWGYEIGSALDFENDLYDPCIDDLERTAALDRFATKSQPPAAP